MSNQSIKAVNKVPNDRLEDLIRAVLLAKMSEADCEMKFDEFDFDIHKDIGQPILVDVHVFGMAGDTTKEEFAIIGPKKNVSVIKGGGSFLVTLDDDSEVKFVFHDIINLNATDYLVTYRLV